MRYIIYTLCAIIIVSCYLYDRNLKISITDQSGFVVGADADPTDYQAALWLLKSHESLRLQSYWDVSRWSIGWGTRSYKGERITRQEADERCRLAFDEVYATLYKSYPHLPRRDALIIAAFCYNTGPVKPNTKLHAALERGDREAIAKHIQLYTKTADGNVLPELEARRHNEATLLLASAERRTGMIAALREKVMYCISEVK